MIFFSLVAFTFFFISLILRKIVSHSKFHFILVLCILTILYLVTQSATEQFVQKHSCTSASHLASNHPLTEEVILTFDQTRFTICNFVY